MNGGGIEAIGELRTGGTKGSRSLLQEGSCAARRAIDCSADSPPAKRAKAAAPGATATRPGTAAELMGGWSQEDLLGASQG